MAPCWSVYRAVGLTVGYVRSIYVERTGSLVLTDSELSLKRCGLFLMWLTVGSLAPGDSPI